MPDPGTPAADAADAVDDPSLTYAAAVAELDELLRELEDEALDVDAVAAKVVRAASLVRICRARIRSAGEAVERVVAELDEGDVAPEPAPGPDPADD